MPLDLTTKPLFNYYLNTNSISATPADEKSKSREEDGSSRIKAAELEAMCAAVRQFGSAQKVTEFGTTVFTGEASDLAMVGDDHTSIRL